MVEGTNPTKGVTYEMVVSFNLNLISTRPVKVPKIQNITYIYVDEEPDPIKEDVLFPKIRLDQYGMHLLTASIIFSIITLAIVHLILGCWRRIQEQNP